MPFPALCYKQGILKCLPSPFPFPCCTSKDVCLSFTGQGSGYVWAPIVPLLADAAGNCSMLVSTDDEYINNEANIAGGAIFSSDWNTTKSLCSPYSLLQLSDQQPGCGIPAWQNNSAGYGSSVAYPPSKILLDTPPFLAYVSNSLDTLPMTVLALDQAGTRVDLGMSSPLVSHAKFGVTCPTTQSKSSPPL